MTLLASQSRRVKLGDLFSVKHGYAFKSEFFSNSGPHILLTPGSFHEAGGFKSKGEREKYYTGPVHEDYILNHGDLIVAMTEQGEGLLGSSAVVPKPSIYLHNQRLGRIVDIKADLLDQKFLYYVFNTQSVRDQIRATANGAKVRHTSPSRIYEVEINLPPLEAQQQAADILSAYDDLIENNTRRIQILEEMARAPYREWFVEFRFPGHQPPDVNRPEGEQLPEGWSLRNLADVCKLVMGQSPESKYYNRQGDGLPFHQGVADFGERFVADRVYCSLEGRTAEAGDILFSVRAPVGRLNLTRRKIIIGRGVCAIHPADNRRCFIYEQLKEQFQELDSMGNGAIFKAVSKGEMHGIKMIVPPDSVVDAFERLVIPIYEELSNLYQRNTVLRETRDLLLPKLVSGNIAGSVSIVDTNESLL